MWLTGTKQSGQDFELDNVRRVWIAPDQIRSLVGAHVADGVAVDTEQEVAHVDGSAPVCEARLLDALDEDVSSAAAGGGALVEAKAEDVVDVSADFDEDGAAVQVIVLSNVVLDGEHGFSVLRKEKPNCHSCPAQGEEKVRERRGTFSIKNF
jgi:hypothetical protein